MRGSEKTPSPERVKETFGGRQRSPWTAQRAKKKGRSSIDITNLPQLPELSDSPHSEGMVIIFPCLETMTQILSGTGIVASKSFASALRENGTVAFRLWTQKSILCAKECRHAVKKNMLFHSLFRILKSMSIGQWVCGVAMRLGLQAGE